MTKASVRGMDLRTLFEPRSIALIGATDKSPWSLYTFQNIKDSGFDGGVYLVNPSSPIVHGERTFDSISSLPEIVDLIFVMVPTKVVLPTLRAAVAHGVRSAVILTAGFGETGPEGQLLEDEIIEFARASGLTVLGPNGNGFINAAENITPYGLPIGRPLIQGTVGLYCRAAPWLVRFYSSRSRETSV